MRLFVFKSGSLMADRTFGDEPVEIGSGPMSAIEMADPRIAARQLRLAPRGPGAWEVGVLDENQPTFVNGAKVRLSQSLRHMDEISVGPFVLRVYLDNEADAETRPAVSTSRSAGVLPVGGFVRPYSGTVQLAIDRLGECSAFSSELASIAQTTPLVERVLEHAFHVFRAGCVCVRIHQRTEAGFEIVRASDAKGRPIDVPPLAERLYEQCVELLHRICVPEIAAPGSASALAVPLVSSRGKAMGMLYVESQEGAPPYDSDWLDALTALAAMTAHHVERTIHARTAQRAEVASQENVVARLVQDAVTPQAMPNWPEFQLGAYRRPGPMPRDFHDMLRLANKTASLIVARVNAAGAGLPLLMSQVRSAFRVSSLHADPPHVFTRALNWLVGDSGATIDAACVWVDPGNGTIQYCLAGDAVSVGAIEASGKCRPMPGAGMPPVGKARQFNYTSQQGALADDETLAIVTQGADALRNASNETFSRTRVMECLGDLAGTGLSVALSDLAAEFDEFARGAPCPQDVTVVLLRRAG